MIDDMSIILAAFYNSLCRGSLHHRNELRPLIPHIISGIPQLIYCSCLNVTGAWVDDVTAGFLLTTENDNYHQEKETGDGERQCMSQWEKETAV